MSDSCCQTHSPAPGAFGIENPRGLDALAVDGETGEAVLIMVEPRAWDGTEERIFQLQEKVKCNFVKPLLVLTLLMCTSALVIIPWNYQLAWVMRQWV